MFIIQITHSNLLYMFTAETFSIWPHYVHAIQHTFSLDWLGKSKGNLSGVITGSIILLSLA